MPICSRATATSSSSITAPGYSLYGYLGALGVNRGQRLDAQAAVGTGGLNPAGNPALYFELRVDGAAVDPLQWLKKQR